MATRLSPSCDVLVVGAGPTGLTLACELAQRGTDVQIIDRLPEPSTHTKGLGVHARTLELLDLLPEPGGGSVADRLVSLGRPVPGLGARLWGRRVYLRVDLTSIRSRYPYLLVLSQAATERVLSEHLARYGVSVARGIALTGLTQTGLTQTGPEVTVTLGAAGSRPDAETVDAPEVSLARTESSPADPKPSDPLTVTARYVVGCDGAHSTTRHLLGLPFEGSNYDFVAFLADCRAAPGTDGQAVSAERATFHLQRRGLVAVIPMEDELCRVIGIDFERQDVDPHSPIGFDEVQRTVDAILGRGRVVLSDPVWAGRWGAPLRIVPSYRVGQVLLAGDAAHAHSPAGGQGLNIGVQDAVNLGWKLAAELSGAASPGLLDSYHQERYEIGLRTLRLTDRLIRVLLVRDPVRRRIRAAAAAAMVRNPLVARRLTGELSGVDVNYRFALEGPGESGSPATPAGIASEPSPAAGPLARDKSARRCSIGVGRGSGHSLPWCDGGSHRIHPGDRVPDVAFANDSRATIRLYELLRASGGGWLLLLGHRAVVPAVLPAGTAAYRVLPLGVSPLGVSKLGVSPFGVSSRGASSRGVSPLGAGHLGEGPTGPEPWLRDVFGRAERLLGVGPESALMIRPDAYLASAVTLEGA